MEPKAAKKPDGRWSVCESDQYMKDFMLALRTKEKSGDGS
jgi:hypothetical protein